MTTNIDTQTGATICWSRASIYVDAMAQVTKLSSNLTSKLLNGEGVDGDLLGLYRKAVADCDQAAAGFKEVREWASSPIKGDS